MIEPATLPHRIERIAADTPDRPALVFRDDVIDYGNLHTQASRIAAGLSALGVARGDRVALMLGNCPEYFLTSLAIWWLGAVQVPVNNALRPDEVRFVLEDSGSTVIVVGEATRDVVAETRPDLPDLRQVVVVGATSTGDVSHAALVEATTRCPPLADGLADDLAVIAYTSGTTGHPKGAMLGHRHLVENLAIGQAHLGLGPDDPVLQGLPAFHNDSSFNGVFLAWWCAALAVLMERFDPAVLVREVVRHRVAFLVAVPTILYDLARLPADADVAFTSVRFAVFGGSPTPPEVRRAVEGRFGLRMVQAYGMTEAQYIALDPTEGYVVDDANGRPAPHNRVLLLDDDGREVPLGEVGEICLAQPETGDAAGRRFRPILGYWNNAAETARAFAGDVFHTGDLGRLDGRGFLHVVGRVKDMIIRGGTNIYPAELERVLVQDPRVAEAHVVAQPDARLGEVPSAFVVPADEVELEPERLRIEVNARLARYKRIEQLRLTTRGNIPRNALGKVLKRQLRHGGTHERSG